MNRKYLSFLAFTIVVSLVSGLPVTRNKEEKKEAETSSPATPDVETALEYERYLKEVVEALESDPEFRKKLDKTPEADIRSGKIAQELEYVNHHVRNKLDEIKRRELERLRSLANKEYELANDIDRDHMKISAHLDHKNQHTFEIEDLQKLIKKTSDDLAEADRKRRQEFKEYEMQKEFEHQSQLKEMDEEQRKKFEQELKEKQEKHNKHEKVHHPGGKAQLEEVWEKQDHMDQEFDPRIFFMMHDVDENGFWDEVEVKALFMKELDKVYKSGMPEDDMRERAEEMERMREHVFKEIDVNQDGLISFQEFMDQTKREEFNRDADWKTVDQQPQYTHEEYLEFERRRQEEIQRLVAQGQLPPHPNMPQGYYPNGQPKAAGYQQQQQPQMHYQSPQQQYQQQQQQYQQQQQQQQYQQQQQQQYLQMQQYQQMQQQQQQQAQQYKQPVEQVQLHPNQAYQVDPQQQQAHQQQQQPVLQQKVPQPNQQPVAHQQTPQLQQQQQQQMSSSKNIPQQMGQQQYIPQHQQPQQQQPLPSNNIPNNVQNVVGQVPQATNQNSQPNQNIPVKN